MSKYLSPHELPVLLRVLAWLVFLLGVAGVVTVVVLWLTRGELRMSRVVTSGLYVYSGHQLRHGYRGGLDSVLFDHRLEVRLSLFAIAHAAEIREALLEPRADGSDAFELSDLD